MSTTPPPQPHSWGSVLELIVEELAPLIEQALPIILELTAGLTAKDLTGHADPVFLAKLKPKLHNHGAHSQLVHGWEQASANQLPITALLGAEMAALSGKSGETSAHKLFVAIAVASAIQMRSEPNDLQALTLEQVLG